MRVSGNLLGTTQTQANFQMQGTTILEGAGTDELEAMGNDLGAVASGFVNNFAFGTLEVQNNTTVQLVNLSTNSPGSVAEAVYASNLSVASGSSIVLNGLNLYVPAPAVTSPPMSTSVSLGGTAIFTAAAIGVPAPTVQWQVSTNGGTSFSPISGATSTTLTLNNVTLAQSGNEYEAVFTNNVGSATTTAATLTVTKLPTTTSLTDNGPNPSSTAQSISFTVTVSGGVPDGETVTLEDASNGNAVVPATGTTLSGGSASLTVAAGALSAGLHNLFAVYGGDATLASSQSTTVGQTVYIPPQITPSTTGLPATATSITIAGSGFSAIATNDIVTFNGTAAGIVTSATPTSLTVTSLSGLSAGSLTASVSVNGNSSGAPVTVATVTPVVTFSSITLAANAASLTIFGVGFSSTAANDSVTFNAGTGTVTNATSTSLTVTSLSGLIAGTLTASVTSNSASSGTAAPVATVTPVVTTSNAPVGVNATSMVINGFGFDPTAAHDAVFFSGGVHGTVTTATNTTLTVTSLTGLTTGALSASATVNSQSSGAAVPVATVTAGITPSTADLAATATMLTINGAGFSLNMANDTVSFSGNVTGTVTGASATSLTVTSLTGLIAGPLSASVAVSGVSSPTVQVATVTPVLTSSVTTLAANAASLTIDGFGFSSTAANNSVTFINGGTGTVTNATATTLTVTSLSGLVAGPLVASATSNSVAGNQVQVATVTPVVTTSNAPVALNATSMVIDGFGFDTNVTNDAVAFVGGATGKVTSATNTQLTVTSLTGLTKGALSASVTVHSQSSGTAVQVATVTAAITPSTANLAANATSLTITGVGFSATAANDTVSFSGGATGTVNSATATALNVTGLTGLIAGPLSASVAVSGVSSPSAQVATVTPVVTLMTTNLAANAASLTIHGFGFSTTAANDHVELIGFDGSPTGTVTNATATTLTVTNLSGLVAGVLSAIVTSNSAGSGAAVHVGTVTPVVTASTAGLGVNATSMVIHGFGFDTATSFDTVAFSGGVTGSVTSATNTQLTVTSLTGLKLGALSASATVSGHGSGTAVQVANVTPVVTSSNSSLAANAASLTIHGFGFSTTATNDTVTFTGGATGTVTSATATSLTVTGLTGLSAGSLKASVKVNGDSSGAAVQVATVTPVVTSSTASLAANAASLTIHGFGFSPTSVDDTVAFNNGTGIVTNATATTLTVTSLSGLVTGSLTAIVFSNSAGSGTAVQVATVTPVVTVSTAALNVNATSLVIHGLGFSTTAADDKVILNNGTGTVTSATRTQLTVTSLTGLKLGSLTALVEVNSISNGSQVQVATVVPVVTPSSATLAANAASLTIHGFGFSTTASNDKVTFNNGATGSVTSATATTLTVKSLQGLVAGNLLASVSVNGVSSAAAAPVATVKPVVTPSTTSILPSATTLTINGFGFDPLAANDTVTFSNGVTGTVSTATNNQLVIINLAGLVAGPLLASVTVDSESSGTMVEVASVS